MSGRWRLWLRWVVATNIGFGLGVALEVAVLGRVTTLLAVPLGGIGQAMVLRRYLPTRWAWAVANAAGWWVGGVIATPMLSPVAQQLSFWPYAILFGLIAGAVVGVTTRWALHRGGLQVGWWWIPLSSVGWGVQAPGMVTGIALARLLPRHEAASNPPSVRSDTSDPRQTPA